MLVKAIRENLKRRPKHFRKPPKSFQHYKLFSTLIYARYLQGFQHFQHYFQHQTPFNSGSSPKIESFPQFPQENLLKTAILPPV
jgi:hypothetical protein